MVSKQIFCDSLQFIAMTPNEALAICFLVHIHCTSSSKTLQLLLSYSAFNPQYCVYRPLFQLRDPESVQMVLYVHVGYLIS